MVRRALGKNNKPVHKDALGLINKPEKQKIPNRLMIALLVCFKVAARWVLIK